MKTGGMQGIYLKFYAITGCGNDHGTEIQGIWVSLQPENSPIKTIIFVHNKRGGSTRVIITSTNSVDIVWSVVTILLR